MSTLSPFHNHIIFEFEDKSILQDGVAQFVDQTESGIEVVRHKESCDAGRWGYIVYLGPEAIEEGFKVGMRVFIEPLKWTNALKFNDTEIHRTDTDQILCIDETHELGSRKKYNDHSAVGYQH